MLFRTKGIYKHITQTFFYKSTRLKGLGMEDGDAGPEMRLRRSDTCEDFTLPLLLDKHNHKSPI